MTGDEIMTRDKMMRYTSIEDKLSSELSRGMATAISAFFEFHNAEIKAHNSIYEKAKEIYVKYNKSEVVRWETALEKAGIENAKQSIATAVSAVMANFENEIADKSLTVPLVANYSSAELYVPLCSGTAIEEDIAQYIWATALITTPLIGTLKSDKSDVETKKGSIGAYLAISMSGANQLEALLKSATGSASDSGKAVLSSMDSNELISAVNKVFSLAKIRFEILKPEYIKIGQYEQQLRYIEKQLTDSDIKFGLFGYKKEHQGFFPPEGTTVTFKSGNYSAEPSVKSGRRINGDKTREGSELKPFYSSAGFKAGEVVTVIELTPLAVYEIQHGIVQPLRERGKKS